MSGHDLPELSDRCAHARDADDARVILRALGLLP